MNYSHHYHAGNHADVLKHIVLSLILDYLKQKEKPFLVVDTHAGAGLYDLLATAADKTGEWQEGIGALLPIQDWPSTLRSYRDVLVRENPQLAHGGHLRLYPGSPRLIGIQLRPEDRLTLGELHPDAARKLRHALDGLAIAPRVVEGDGYHLLKSELPPREKRGLVHIDPPFEDKREFEAMVAALAEGHRRFATGTYALWYPIKSRAEVQRFHTLVKNTGIRRILAAELLVRPDDVGQRLNGSGMLIVNPPWSLHDQLKPLLPWLQRRLAPDTGKWHLNWLAGE